MKKQLCAAAVAAAASGAMAQSSVTIFGVVDVNLQHASQGGVHADRLVGVGGNQFSRIGLRGTEDLGAGLSAGFTLDAGFNVDSGAGVATSLNNQASGAGPSCTVAGATGATCAVAVNGAQGLTFSRRSTVSLVSRDWGELRLGRDFVPTYWNLSAFDPFGSAGAGNVNNLAQSALTSLSTVQTSVRASNTIGYLLPSLGGFYGQAMYALGENASNAAGGISHDGRYAGVRLGYSAGPINVAASHGRTSLFAGDVTTTNAGGSYDFGVAKVMAQYFRDSKEKVAAPNHASGWLVGAQVMAGSGYVPVSYTRVKNNFGGRTASQAAVGYVHNLSKRTALYTTYSHIQNKNGAALTGGGVAGVANRSWTGVDVGVRHTF